MTTLLSLKNVNFNHRIGNTEVTGIKNITFDFIQAQSYSITGQSGSGKSTLATIMALLRVPQSGDISFQGCELSATNENQISKMRTQIGIIFQRYHIDDTDTVLNNVLLPIYFLRRVNIANYAKDAIQLLEQLGLKNEIRRKAATLSGGQRQRVAIARSLITKPSLIIADEPTGNLDSKTTLEVSGLLFKVAQRMNSTLVVVTHDHDLAKKASFSLQMHDGALIHE